ncbi:MAG: ketoacyl-ACP synthase III [Proteobacteria bacterium]|nr:MAG: ketoacyl-ACP synthase III [Pseudomonadota bacterium]
MSALKPVRLGITEIASYIPERRIDNADKAKTFEMDQKFLADRIGVLSTARKEDSETCSDLCVKAFDALKAKTPIDIQSIEVIIVVTQNPDHSLPHASAVVHGKLGASEDCACFDISLGCSGYVYGLSSIISFMESNGFKKGLLFTSDSYSKIIDPNDRNTALIFGDASSVTLISPDSKLECSNFSFGTNGSEYDKLIVRDNRLHMDGPAVFNFAAQTIPKDIEKVLAKAGLTKADIDFFVIHQGSKFIVETIGKRLGVPSGKVPFEITDYGNTVSSSIPLILEKFCGKDVKLIASGYGLGLSWASCLIKSR